jgi:hypothetical protein
MHQPELGDFGVTRILCNSYAANSLPISHVPLTVPTGVWNVCFLLEPLVFQGHSPVPVDDRKNRFYDYPAEQEALGLTLCVSSQ